MNDNQAMVSCAVGSWLVAAFAGALAMVLLLLVGGWGFLQAAFIGAVVFVGAGVLISVIMCRPLPPISAQGDQTDAAPAPAPKAKAAPEATTSAALKSSKPLPGQDELAARKGEWKYGSDTAAPKSKPAPAAEGPGTKPQVMTAARDNAPDNLKQIKGVGPKLESLLHEMGFYHFDQIAAWTADEVSWVDQNLQGFKGRVSRDDWVEQARILADGGTTEFSSKVKKGDVY